MADDDWDAEGFDPDKGFVTEDDKWKDEDKDLNLEELKATEDKKPTVPAAPKKSKQERIEEKKAQRRAEELSKEKTDQTVADKNDEKLRLQKVQKESDLELAKTTFGVEKDEGNTIDGMNPKTQEEFDKFREALKTKFKSLELSPLYVSFMENMLRDLATSLDVEDIRRLSATLTHIATEKQKAAKGSKGKKKGGKVSLAIGKAAKKVIDDFDDDMGAEFDDFI